MSSVSSSLDFESIVIELESYYISLKHEVCPQRASLVCINTDLDKKLHHGSSSTLKNNNVHGTTADDHLFVVRHDADGMTRVTDNQRQCNDDDYEDCSRFGMVMPTDSYEPSFDEDTVDRNWSGFVPKPFVKMKEGKQRMIGTASDEEPEYDLANCYESITEQCIANLSQEIHKSPMKVQKRGHVLVVTCPDHSPPLPPKMRKPPPLPPKIKDRGGGRRYSETNALFIKKSGVYSSKTTLHHSRTSLGAFSKGSPRLTSKFQRRSSSSLTTTKQASREELYLTAQETLEGLSRRVDCPILMSKTRRIRASSFQTIQHHQQQQEKMTAQEMLIRGNPMDSPLLLSKRMCGSSFQTTQQQHAKEELYLTAQDCASAATKSDFLTTSVVDRKNEESCEKLFVTTAQESFLDSDLSTDYDTLSTDYDTLEGGGIGKSVTVQGLLKDLDSVQLIRENIGNVKVEGSRRIRKGIPLDDKTPLAAKNTNVRKKGKEEKGKHQRRGSLVTSLCDVRDDTKIWSVAQLMDAAAASSNSHQTQSVKYDTTTTMHHSSSSVQKYQKIGESSKGSSSVEMQIYKQRTEIRKKKAKKSKKSKAGEEGNPINRRSSNLTPLTRLRLYEVKRRQQLSLKPSNDGADGMDWMDSYFLRVYRDEENNWNNTPLFHPFWYECMYLAQRRCEERQKREFLHFKDHSYSFDRNPTTTTTTTTTTSGTVRNLSYYNETDDIFSIYKYFW